MLRGVLWWVGSVYVTTSWLVRWRMEKYDATAQEEREEERARNKAQWATINERLLAHVEEQKVAKQEWAVFGRKQDDLLLKQDALLLKLRQRRASQAERDDDPTQ